MADAPKQKPDIGAIMQNHRLVTAALRKGIREDILRHKAEGLPIAVWEDGRVKWIAPEDITAESPEE